MSAFGRSRRQVWLNADLWDLLRAAAPHEIALEAGEGTLVKGNVLHTADTLHDSIIRQWFEREDKQRYAELVRMRSEAEHEAEAEWEKWFKLKARPSSNAQPLSPSGPSAQESD